MTALLLLLIALAVLFSHSSCLRYFKPVLGSSKTTRRRIISVSEKENNGEQSNKKTISVDVSDLGIAMSDLQKPMSEIATRCTGIRNYYSWIESPQRIEIEMNHPGMRGQPAGAVDVQFSDTTVSITIYSYMIWSGICVGPIYAPECSFKSEEGPDGIPTIKISLQKAVAGNWFEFISDVGVDSLLD